MTSLDSLFVGEQPTQRDVAARADGRLEAIVGAAAHGSTPLDHAVERRRLHQLVGEGAGLGVGVDPRAAPALPSAAQTRTRARSKFLRRQRRDWLAVASAAAAMVAIIGASFVGVRAAVASTPTGDARTLLQFGEEALASSVAAVNAERKRVEVTRSDMMAAADLSATALGSLVGIADEELRQGALAARDAFVTELAAISVPTEFPLLEGEALDRGATLSQIGAALEVVNARQLDVDAVHQELADLRNLLEAKRDAYRLTVVPLADSMIALAATSIEQNVEALPEFRVAVQNSASVFAAARATGRAGWAEMQALGDAIRALRADEERVLLEAEEARSSSRSAGRPNGGSNGDSGASSPGDAPAPVEPGPGTPTDGATDGGSATDGGTTGGGVTDGATPAP